MNRDNSYRCSHQSPMRGEYYDELFETSSWVKFIWQREQDTLVKVLNDFYRNKKITLLDFACGTGRITEFLEDKVNYSTSVDVSESMLKIARKKLKLTKIIKADLTNNNILIGKKYNLITAFRFFLNAELELRREVLEVIVSLLSQDGYFLFNIHQNWGSPIVKLKYLYSKLKLNDNYNVLCVREMNILLKEFGLEIVKIYPIGFLRTPKLELPEDVYNRIENIILKFKLFTQLSESPIIITQFINNKK